MRGQDAAVVRACPRLPAPRARPRRRRRRTARRWCGPSSRGCARRSRRRSRGRACASPRCRNLSAVATRVDEAGADRLQVEGGAVVDAEPGLDLRRRRREGVVRRRGRADDEVDVVGRRARRRRAPRSAALMPRIEVVSPSAAMWRCLDAGALHDPLVGGVDHLGEVVVRHDALRQIGADAADDGTDALSRCAVPQAVLAIAGVMLEHVADRLHQLVMRPCRRRHRWRWRSRARRCRRGS